MVFTSAFIYSKSTVDKSFISLITILCCWVSWFHFNRKQLKKIYDNRAPKIVFRYEYTNNNLGEKIFNFHFEALKIVNYWIVFYISITVLWCSQNFTENIHYCYWNQTWKMCEPATNRHLRPFWWVFILALKIFT